MAINPLAKSTKVLDDMIAKLEAELGEAPFDLAAAKKAAAAANKGGKGGKGGGKQQGGDKKAPAAGTGEEKSKQQQQGKEGAGKKKGGAAPAPAEDVLPICRIDLRVGRVVEAVPHPDAETLYLEKIDFGEGEPRQVISGLGGTPPKIPIEQMQGARVVGVCNLKPVKMRGILSHAMILATSDESGKVELIEPPEDAPLGEVLSWEGFPPLNPDTPHMNPKKKIWETCQPDFLVEPGGAAAYQGKKLMSSKGPCVCKSLRGTPIK